jgi:tyrosine-protein phosphatase SIW14
MRRHVGNLLGVLIVILLIVAPVVWAGRHLEGMRNFRTVRKGVLYRSGQMSINGLRRIIHDHGIKTVITLRDSYTPGEPPPDRSEEEFVRSMALNYYRIPPRQWATVDGKAPADEGIQKFVAIMSDPRNHPVLVHCFGGIHRAGAFSAVYRMEFEGWSNEEAIVELRACGYTNLDDHWDIQGYLARYEPTWRRQAQAAP